MNNNKKLRIMYIQPTTGIAGDMFIAACVDAGVDRDYLISTLKKCFPDIIEVTLTATKKQGLRGLTLTTKCKGQATHRHWCDIQELISDIPAGTLSVQAKTLALAIFETIASAESYVHSVSLDNVHFHEVGALDSLLDIVGAALCLEQLKIDKVYCAPLPVGGGLVKCEHGLLPVPAPATARILQGIPLANTTINSELTTPTGAAIVKVICTDFITSLPDMVINEIGYGAGKRDLEVPNLLRVFIGEQLNEASADKAQSLVAPDYITEKLVIIETTLDDMQPEQLPQLIELLHSLGALEVTLHEVLLKKGRLGKTLKTLSSLEHVASLKRAIFKHSTSLGVRSYVAERESIVRTYDSVTVRGLTVNVKIGKINQEIVNVSPEYEDCLYVANKKSVAVKIVFQEAIVAWYKLNPSLS